MRLKTALVAENIWRIINTIASLWREKQLENLPLNIICRKTVHFSEQIMIEDKCLRAK